MDQMKKTEAGLLKVWFSSLWMLMVCGGGVWNTFVLQGMMPLHEEEVCG